ncbi:hypothetical protein NMG60_11020488 [Bertholletia excelsa]
MKNSCNGCRVLRKGCSANCSLRLCLQWIKSSVSQANATIFLAKFYGRAGLLNLVNAGPSHLRPRIFQSLLYEACGRIINPIYGSVGLLSSGDWDRCQVAVDSILNGSPIGQVSSDYPSSAAHPIMPLSGCDIRHFTKNSPGLNRVPTRTRFKRSRGRGRSKSHLNSFLEFTDEPAQFSISGWGGNHDVENLTRASSHESSMFSVQTVEASLVSRSAKSEDRAEEGQLGLELSLGFSPVEHGGKR